MDLLRGGDAKTDKILMCSCYADNACAGLTPMDLAIRQV